MYKLYFKPLLDIVLSFFAILILSPVLIIVGIMVFTKLGKPIIFTVERPGKNEKIFTLYKFRTMDNKRDDKGQLLIDKMRLTKFGRFLRNTSLDELPQLFNILKGDMSLVGPRPLLVDYLPRYTDFQRRRHEVTPGITGWAQVNGRNDISWTQKFELDVWYVDHISLKLDLKVLFLTLLRVIRRDGINKKGEATTVAFNGNN